MPQIDRSWMAWIIGLFLVITAGQIYVNARSTPPAATPTVEPTITAVSARQSSEGVTPDQMDVGFLERLGEYLQSRVNQKTASAYRHEGTYMNAGGNRFAVIRLTGDGLAPMLQVVGIQNGEMVRVTCVSDMPAVIPISRGPCAAKIRETFGVEFSETASAPATGLAESTPPTVPTRSNPSAFIKASFDDISIELPTNWRWMGQSDAAALNTNSEALARTLGSEVHQGNNEILVAGNAFNDEKQSVATVRLSIRRGTEGSQADMREGLREPQDTVESMMRADLERTAATMRGKPGIKYYRVIGAGLRKNPSVNCTWSQFEYDAGTGATVNDMWICPLGGRTLKLTTSYQKNRTNLYSDTIDYIWKSVRVGNKT